MELAKTCKYCKEIEQLLFDSNSKFTSPEFYQKIFGKCALPDCLDKKCAIYKGVCCKKFPDSPNCKTFELL